MLLRGISSQVQNVYKIETTCFSRLPAILLYKYREGIPRKITVKTLEQLTDGREWRDVKVGN